MHHDLLSFAARLFRDPLARHTDRVQMQDVIIILFIQRPFDPLRIQRRHLMTHGVPDAGTPDHMLSLKIKKYFHLFFLIYCQAVPCRPHTIYLFLSISQNRPRLMTVYPYLFCVQFPVLPNPP